MMAAGRETAFGLLTDNELTGVTRGLFDSFPTTAFLPNEANKSFVMNTVILHVCAGHILRDQETVLSVSGPVNGSYGFFAMQAPTCTNEPR